MRWLDATQVTVSTSTSPLGFDISHTVNSEGAANPVGYRFLTVNGQRAFDLGNFCGTCSFLFDRLEGAPRDVSPGALDGPLRSGLRQLDPPVVDAASLVIPPGTYDVCLLEMTPWLVRPFSDNDYFTREQVELWGAQSYDYWTGLPHFTHAAYYRGGDMELGDSRKLFQFLVPLFPPVWLDKQTISAYAARLGSGERPTALALSVLDVKQPAIWSGDPKITEHWCMVHYLVDGHHKVYAAAETHHPVTLMTFLARDEGASSPSQVETALSVLRTSGSNHAP